MFKKDIFGNVLIVKKIVLFLFGLISKRRYKGFNDLQIEGMELLRYLPDNQVLFVSNHQTYFADAAAMFHVFFAALNGQNDIHGIKYLFHPKTNIYYVAAKETMTSGILPRIFMYVGAIPINRTWRSKGKDIKRSVNFNDITNISKAIQDGWVITFPQGTTTPFKPIRRGTAHIIKTNKPIVVPIVIDGFRRSFDKKGLQIKKRGITQRLIIKPPLIIDYENDTIDEIVENIAFAIEQHQDLVKVPSIDSIKEEVKQQKKHFWTGKNY
ncbi:MAG TPA: 1-acyl-sn-glycerol-3-phosphate acyltransferase [Flavobacteriia bacterium]|jgi:1-acyl-sn-glycerol-3-phosphate acyltransferase|nr:1-acyl-sn-glycerol-3-phosphate acyltransferase [Flavobacteriia bacterium]